MSKKSIDFGDDVCYYEDISDNSNLMYVKGCPSGKSCELVGTEADQYRIHTCQVIQSVSKKNLEETCDDGLYECINDLPCTSGKCSSGTDPSVICTTIIKKVNYGTPGDCITDTTQIANIGNLCYSQESETSDIITYDHISSSKECKKLQIEQNSAEQYYIKNKEIVDLFSVQDGNYVEQNSNDYCESGFSLFFYGNGKLILSGSGNEMFKRCVTVLSLKKISSGSLDYLIKYKINNGNEYIYDTSKLPDTPDTYKSKQNTECYLLMTKLELFKYMKEEYKTNGASNNYIKWNYLYNNPEKYLLYKDQIDVLDYLIQKIYPSYIPERLAQQPTTTPKTEPSNSSKTPEPSNTEETETESSELLNIKYLITLLFLFIF